MTEKIKTKRQKPKYKGDITKLIELFSITLKLGAFTFGGGYAMFPLMEREYVEKKGWFETEEMLDILAVSQSLPGMISINASIMVGYRLFGVLGSMVAVFGLALPSLIVLSLISYFYLQFKENTYVNAALSGIRVAVIGLLIQAVIKLGKPGVKGVFGWTMAAIAFLMALLSGVHPIFIILGGTFVGILYMFIKERSAKTGDAP
ncbi:MAG: chromate transporter [Firmicutes bacterium]|nr:chromate transporter [Bacillota bacterium]